MKMDTIMFKRFLNKWKMYLIIKLFCLTVDVVFLLFYKNGLEHYFRDDRRSSTEHYPDGASR